MNHWFPLLLFLLLVAAPAISAKTLDPYKVLGVDKSATQREIQKAFHKLSLQYHPDKNKSKSAQEKFTEINNAYEILSDEEKRKNYDLYGDEKGSPNFGASNYGNGDTYTHFTGGPGSDHFTSYPGGYQSAGGQGNTKSFSFSFDGGRGMSGNQFGFDIGDVFSNLFGNGMGGSQFGGSSGFGGPKAGSASSGVIEDVNSQFYHKKINGQGLTWILLFYTPSAKGYHVFNSMVEDVANSLSGAVKAGRVNCQNEQTFCKEIGISTSRSARLYIYSQNTRDRGSLVEFDGELDSRSLKKFCLDQLPRFTKHVDLNRFDFSSSNEQHLPQVLLLSSKKETPVMWRALSGLYRHRFVFYDAEVNDGSHPFLRRLGVDALPAVVGRLVDGEVHVLRTGITVKDLKSGINELSSLLERFEMKSKKAAKRPPQRDSTGVVPYITETNFDSLCGDRTTVCFIGVFRSSKAKGKLEALLSAVSQKTFVRQQSQVRNSGDSVTYALLDAGKYAGFLSAFDASRYKSLDTVMVAYKPKRGRFAVFTGQMTLEEVEKFVSSVLNGDVRFSQVRHRPVLG